MIHLGELPRLGCAGLLVSVAFVLSPPHMAFADEPPAVHEPVWQDAGGIPPVQHEAGDDPALALRLQHRQSGRLTLDLNLGISNFKHQPNAGDPFLLARFLFGYRKNFEPTLGYHLRAGAILGRPSRRTSGDPGPDGIQVDTTTLTGGSVEGLFVFGPFGRFFVGPVLCLDYAYLTNTTLHNVYPTVHLKNGVTAGGGFDLGGAFGSREQFTVYQTFRITAGAGESLIFLLLGIGYLR